MFAHIAERTSIKAPRLMPRRGVGNDAHTSPERSEPLPWESIDHSVRQDKVDSYFRYMPLPVEPLRTARRLLTRKFHSKRLASQTLCAF